MIGPTVFSKHNPLTKNIRVTGFWYSLIDHQLHVENQPEDICSNNIFNSKNLQSTFLLAEGQENGFDRGKVKSGNCLPVP